jgi:hypothetical protein
VLVSPFVKLSSKWYVRTERNTSRKVFPFLRFGAIDKINRTCVFKYFGEGLTRSEQSLAADNEFLSNERTQSARESTHSNEFRLKDCEVRAMLRYVSNGKSGEKMPQNARDNADTAVSREDARIARRASTELVSLKLDQPMNVVLAELLLTLEIGKVHDERTTDDDAAESFHQICRRGACAAGCEQVIDNQATFA